MMLFRFALVALLCGVSAPLAVAKRIAPKDVAPVSRDGVEYSAPSGVSNMGMVRAREGAGGKVLWEQKIYEVEIDPKLERDVQWVFISDLKLHGGLLIITDERQRHFSLDLETREVRRIRDAHPAVVPAGPVEMMMGIVSTDPDGESPDDLRVLIYLRNTGDEPLKLLTRNLQVDLFAYPDKPAELNVTLSAQKVIHGSKVIPSEAYLAPVVLAKGEVAEIKVLHRDRQKLSEVVLVYDMRNDITRRYEAWSGRVRGPLVEVIKYKPER